MGPHKRTSSAINVNVEIFMMQPPSDAFFYFSLFPARAGARHPLRLTGYLRTRRKNVGKLYIHFIIILPGF